MANNPLLFYTNMGVFELSNYYLAPLTFENREYKSSEHAFQAAKFLYPDAPPQNVAYAEQIRNAKTPNIARVLALQKVGGGYKWRTDLNPIIAKSLKDNVNMRVDWDAVRDDVMKRILIAKFSQNPRCKSALLNTHPRPLVEHTERDKYWADGGDGSGLNRLGQLLMEVRLELLQTNLR